MAALAWLLIPVVAVVAASIWGSWAGRRRTTTPDVVGVAGYERFRAAMERTGPSLSGPEGPGTEGPARSPRAAAAPARAVAHAAPDGPARAGD
ncbi:MULTISPECIES: hypothetical protein [Streptomyces]|uniref:Uncharacterized protein n=1 Tax=Streptomyces cacaoi TaxID=1898 RepID=A0A4Y3R8S2_STRCI|nr:MULTISPECIES: hypothetical protein [Streptomyces]NNG86227.1 hypothetical protein [Streptomyces cacaoi]QHF97049.1 hypothetical protein DEH18_27995 [Streptomyces sp. NHF165]GEB52230.1 hypothetical protein SCA03_47810 [Streptomyces cacaoi]